jgi:hypothetical protein
MKEMRCQMCAKVRIAKNGCDRLQLHFWRAQDERKGQRVIDVITDVGIEQDPTLLRNGLDGFRS